RPVRERPTNGYIATGTHSRVGWYVATDSFAGRWKKKSGFSSGCVNPSSNQRPTMAQVVMELNECVALEIARRQGSQEIYSKDSVVTLVSLLLQSLPREPDNLKIYSDFAHLPGFPSSFGKFSNRENHIYFPPPLWLNPRRVQPPTTSEGPPLLPEDHIMEANLTLAGENRACSVLTYGT
ncbi:hypothetical protein F2Q70_00043150, partial [Brassica cretica]